MKVKVAACLSFLLAVMAIGHGTMTLAAGDKFVIPAFAIVIGLATLILLWWAHIKRRA